MPSKNSIRGNDPPKGGKRRRKLPLRSHFPTLTQKKYNRWLGMSQSLAAESATFAASTESLLKEDFKLEEVAAEVDAASRYLKKASDLLLKLANEEARDANGN